MNPTLSLVAVLIVVAALVGAGAAVHHRGYRAGQAEREAYYAPILRAQSAAKLAADQRADQLAAAADAATRELEGRYAEQNRILTNRANAAQSRLADILRNTSPGTCTGHQQMPEPPATAPGAIGTPGSDDRVGRLATSLAGVGGRCEADAARLQHWQEWFRTQQALADRAATRP